MGPQSAGSIPGPACYGRAGREPTVTDANLLLNRLPGDALLGGAMPLDRKAAEDALSERLCSRLGTGIGETALGILAVANLNMSKILRIVSIERGLDPRGFSMLCFGGAGPLHAAELAESIRAAVEALEIAHAGNTPERVTVSIGAAVLQPTAGQEPELAVRRADEAMYFAKRDGRNCVRMCAASPMPPPSATQSG